MKKITIAIDGFSSCGKSTLAKDLANEVGYIHIDTGAMYRAVTLYGLRQGLVGAQGIDTQRLSAQMDRLCITFVRNAATGKPQTMLNGECVEPLIRSMEVAAHVSAVAALPFVRQEMVNQQRAMGRDKGVVLDGRDIGTVVFPDAELKLFVTAAPEIRAQRRYDELTAKGVKCHFDDILANVLERDRIDTTREISPLRQAPDAIVLDNSYLSIPQQKEWLLAQFRRAIEQE